MRREFGDRVLSLFVPVLRCRCAAGICGWQGLVRRSTANAALLMGSGFYASRQVLEPSRGRRTADAPHTAA